MTTLIFLVLFLAVALILWLRFSPLDRDVWHVDPAVSDAGGEDGVRFVGLDAPRYPADAEEVLETFAAIAREEPRTRVLEGAVDEGLMTFVARSPVLGLPDLITVKAVNEGAATKLSIVARPRYALSDAEANADRLDRWLQEMRLRLGEA